MSTTKSEDTGGEFQLPAPTPEYDVLVHMLLPGGREHYRWARMAHLESDMAKMAMAARELTAKDDKALADEQAMMRELTGLPRHVRASDARPAGEAPVTAAVESEEGVADRARYFGGPKAGQIHPLPSGFPVVANLYTGSTPPGDAKTAHYERGGMDRDGDKVRVWKYVWVGGASTPGEDTPEGLPSAHDLDDGAAPADGGMA